MFKQYLTADNYYKQKYKRKVIRIPLDGNFTCPNIDGTKSTEGCTYCLRQVNPLTFGVSSIFPDSLPQNQSKSRIYFFF